MLGERGRSWENVRELGGVGQTRGMTASCIDFMGEPGSLGAWESKSETEAELVEPDRADAKPNLGEMVACKSFSIGNENSEHKVTQRAVMSHFLLHCRCYVIFSLAGSTF